MAGRYKDGSGRPRPMQRPGQRTVSRLSISDFLILQSSQQPILMCNVLPTKFLISFTLEILIFTKIYRVVKAQEGLACSNRHPAPHHLFACFWGSMHRGHLLALVCKQGQRRREFVLTAQPHQRLIFGKSHTAPPFAHCDDRIVDRERIVW